MVMVSAPCVAVCGHALVGAAAVEPEFAPGFWRGFWPEFWTGEDCPYAEVAETATSVRDRAEM